MTRLYGILITSLILFTGFKTSGQDTLKFRVNNWATELNFNPFDGSLSFNNASGQIKVRKFGLNNTALRLALNFNYVKDNTESDNKYGTSPTYYSERKGSTTLGFTIGEEKHFKGSRRLSPYIGGELGFSLKTSTHDINNNSTVTNIKGAWELIQSYNGQYNYTTFTERAYWSLGGNFISGFDFYMTKGFYIGYEILFGIDYIKYKNIDITQTGTNVNSSSYPTYNDESWRFGPKLQNGIRLGFIF